MTQASLGSIGSAPGNENSPLIYSLTTTGRLVSVKQFENVILRTTADGGLVKLKDAATIELGSESYTFASAFDGSPAGMLLVSQAAGSNALDVMKGVEK